MVEYMEREAAQYGTPWAHIARHMLGLRHSPGRCAHLAAGGATTCSKTARPRGVSPGAAGRGRVVGQPSEH